MMKNRLFYYLINIFAVLWISVFSCMTFLYMINYNLSEEDKIPSISEIYHTYGQKEYIIKADNCVVGQQGTYITSGPYLFLLPGKYSIIYQVKGFGRMYVDIASEKGERLFFADFYDIGNSDIINIESSFELPVMIKDFEARTKFISGEYICVDKIILKQEQIDWIAFIKKTMMNLPQILSL